MGLPVSTDLTFLIHLTCLEPVPVALEMFLNSTSGAAGFSVSRNGVLALRKGSGAERVLLRTDASGKPLGTVGPAGLYENPRISPDGTRLAFSRLAEGTDIWLADLERGTTTRFTFNAAADIVPIWSPDGKWIAFSSDRDGGIFNVYRRNAGGTGDDELLVKNGNRKIVNDWSADGRTLFYQEESPDTKADIWMVPTAGGAAPVKVLGTPFNESAAALSPDGHWLAYTSDESGVRQVYVQTFPPSERKWQVSAGRAASARWRADGKVLFFDVGGMLSAVDVSVGPDGDFKAGRPRQLFFGLLNLPPHNFDVEPGGSTFLSVRGQEAALQGGANSPIVLTVNWQTGLPLSR